MKMQKQFTEIITLIKEARCKMNFLVPPFENGGNSNRGSLLLVLILKIELYKLKYLPKAELPPALAGGIQ
jgi:hypothetical protein